ncbi:MAG TPA: hypothetical protein VFZ23_08990, partial [Pyrinomonadaceae bacterium]
LVREILMSKTVEERFLLAAAMYEDAKELARIGMPAGLSDEEQEAYVFRKLHGANPIDLVNNGDA